jgi:hypothetical protein
MCLQKEESETTEISKPRGRRSHRVLIPDPDSAYKMEKLVEISFP